MSTIRFLLAAAGLAGGLAAPALAQNGVVPAASAPLPAAVAARKAASAPAQGPRRGSLAHASSRRLNAADVPSRANPPSTLKAQADADLARRDARPRLKVERQNLKEDEAARAIAQQHNAGTYDRDIAVGDKDHTEQAAGIKISVKK